MIALNAMHNSALHSWVESANAVGTDFLATAAKARGHPVLHDLMALGNDMASP